MTDIKDFLAGIGVNTHLDAGTTGYGDVALVRASLAYLGVSLIRDHAYDVSLAAFRSLATAGVKFDLILDDDPKAELDSLVPIFPAIRFAEGPNEVDYQPILTNGIANPVLAAVTEQASVAAALVATPALRGTPLIAESMASADNLRPYAANLAHATVANLHSYGANGASPGSVIAADAATARALSPLPLALTETGYYSMPTDDSGVDESVQARLTLDTLFDAVNSGITPVILYELLDEASDPGNTDGQLHYGLFHADGSPKPVATALRNLTTILTAADATPGVAPTVTIDADDAPDTAHAVTLAGAAGTTVAVIWAEPQLWDPVTHAVIAPPQTPTHLSLGSTIHSVLVFDPLLGTAPIATYADISSLTLLLTDHPLLLQLSAAPAIVPTPVTPEPSAVDPTTAPAAPVASPPIVKSPAPLASVIPTVGVYRFFETTNGTHFYTADAAEAQTIRQTRPDLTPEGIGLRAIDPTALSSTDPAATPIYRFFDALSGTQFLTASAAERDTVIATRPDLHYEATSRFYEHAIAQPGDTPVYRFFDTVQGTHFYTDDPTERGTILSTRPDLVAEGIGFYEPPDA